MKSIIQVEYYPHWISTESFLFIFQQKEGDPKWKWVTLMLNSRPVSRVLCPLRGVCHSSMQYVTTLLKRSTLRLGRATLKCRFTWTCSLQDTRPVHRCTAGGLLPHLLTLTLAGGYFLLRYSAFADSFLLGSGMLCAARTFLLCPDEATATDRPTVLSCNYRATKLTHFAEFTTIEALLL